MNNLNKKSRKLFFKKRKGEGYAKKIYLEDKK
jgi:hypothetical protein